MQSQRAANAELTVFIANRVSTCGECGEPLGAKVWITLAREKGALCLACADLEHLLFLPAGDGALTRRARQHSTLSAVVLQWSRAGCIGKKGVTYAAFFRGLMHVWGISRS